MAVWSNKKMRYNELGKTQRHVSFIGLGGAAFSNIYGDFNEEEGIALIQEALKSGINYFETGHWYGQGTSERTYAKALDKVPRNTYILASKVGRYEKETSRMFDFSAERTAAAVDNTLAVLKADYVDILQVHDLSFASDINVIIRETLPALAKAVADGKTAYIGLADYDIGLMKDVVEESEVEVNTILSYAKSTLCDNSLQNYVNYFGGRGIGVINAAATGMGLLTNAGPPEWHPASNEIKMLCHRAAEYCRRQGLELGRIATWFSLNQPGIHTNLCGFRSVKELRDTLSVVENGLTAQEDRVMAEILNQYYEGTTLNWDGVEVAKYMEKMKALNL